MDWFDALRNIAAAIGALAAILLGLGVINAKVVSPLVSDPIAHAVGEKLRDVIIEVVRGDDVRGYVQEEVASELGVIIDSVGELHRKVDDEVIPRLERVERNQGLEPPPRRGA